MRFKAFNLIIDQGALGFYKIRKDETSEAALQFEHGANEFRVQLGPTEKCTKSGNNYSAVALILHTGLLRAIYFPSVQTQQDMYLKILQLQGFNTPSDQYAIAFTDSNAIIQKGKVTTIMRARHRMTDQTVAVKLIDKSQIDESSVDM